ncbi:MAG TPA: hypothetical protein VMW20_00730 [Candidatus Nanoarchaeia archaeon]|nr:hypothetical protein [Candidatus Nanoarchaeia archaeon]
MVLCIVVEVEELPDLRHDLTIMLNTICHIISYIWSGSVLT